MLKARSRSRSRSLPRRRVSQVSDDQPFMCLIPPLHAESVCGANSCELERVEKITGATFALTSSEESRDRIFLISGNETSKNEALGFILDRLRTCQGLSRSALGVFYMLVPERVAPMIIGKKGMVIREMKIESGCDISIEEEIVHGTVCRAIAFRGDFKETRSATNKVQRVVREYLSRGKITKVDFSVESAKSIKSSSSGNSSPSTRSSSGEMRLGIQLKGGKMLTNDIVNYLRLEWVDSQERKDVKFYISAIVAGKLTDPVLRQMRFEYDAQIDLSEDVKDILEVFGKKAAVISIFKRLSLMTNQHG